MTKLEAEVARLRSRLDIVEKRHGYVDCLTAFECRRLVEWIKDKNRKPAHSQFTASALRDAARAVEKSGVLEDKNDKRD